MKQKLTYPDSNYGESWRAQMNVSIINSKLVNSYYRISPYLRARHPHRRAPNWSRPANYASKQVVFFYNLPMDHLRATALTEWLLCRLRAARRSLVATSLRARRAPGRHCLLSASQSSHVDCKRSHKRWWASGRVELVFEESVLNSISDLYWDIMCALVS